MDDFGAEVLARIGSMARDGELRSRAQAFMLASIKAQYSYNFSWMGRPVIQYPQDMVAMQEIIWRVQPDLIIETGIAHGGSLVLSASLLAMLDYCDAVASGQVLDPRSPRRRVVGIDIDIRAHNRAAMETHPMAHRITMIQGSSVAPEIIAQVRQIAAAHQRVLVCLDSNHTHDHVLAELEAYAPLVSRDSYCVVFDTIVEDLPEGLYPDRPWGRGDNPKTAVREYLRRIEKEGREAADGSSLQLACDSVLEGKLLTTVAPDGYLKRTG